MRGKIFPALALCVALLAACSSGGDAPNAQPAPSPGQERRAYSADMGELRASFNRDKGQVRLVALLSPT